MGSGIIKSTKLATPLLLWICLCTFSHSVSARYSAGSQVSSAKISGEFKKWHKITVIYTSSETYSEEGTPNPFLNRRLDVVFTQGQSTYTVPGYFAADGNAANTSAASGNIWHAHFCPGKTGNWFYEGRFYSGARVAIADIPGAPADTFSGQFNVLPSDKNGRDLRGKGRLQYVGAHHLQFAETNEWFLKAGADSPENIS